MLNVLFWITFGALIGWIVAAIFQVSVRRSLLLVLIGIGSALLGGFGGHWIADQTLQSYNHQSIYLAACVAIAATLAACRFIDKIRS